MTTISVNAIATITSVVDCRWNSVHHAYGGNRITYLNNGSISQFTHVFGNLTKNVTWRGNDIFIAGFPEVGDTQVYVERWQLSVDNGQACIFQQDGFLVPIPVFQASSPIVLSSSYFA
ncbi:MAG: hypothetical protein F6K65_27795 [Moorea sp. SIO3C2]|nr:hypothetical protein [Moorena sp. SIO3C2]